MYGYRSIDPDQIDERTSELADNIVDLIVRSWGSYKQIKDALCLVSIRLEESTRPVLHRTPAEPKEK